MALARRWIAVGRRGDVAAHALDDAGDGGAREQQRGGQEEERGHDVRAGHAERVEVSHSSASPSPPPRASKNSWCQNPWRTPSGPSPSVPAASASVSAANRHNAPAGTGACRQHRAQDKDRAAAITATGTT
jgi:hypothetical protein